ncbi:MAG: hypothetical protein IPP94_07760 [Ignavibacteria bacterium]|nr:hypothetical protein [Ignavibacteria bacterium]
MHLRFALIAALLLAAVSVSFIDVETAMEQRVRDVIAKYHWQGTYENLGGGWFEFTGTDGLTWKRNFGDVRTQERAATKENHFDRSADSRYHRVWGVLARSRTNTPWEPQCTANREQDGS